MPNQRLERSIPQNNQFERNPVRFIGRQGWSCADQYCYARAGGEIIASDVSLLVTFNHAIDGVIQNNPKASANPKSLAQFNGYKGPLVSSLSATIRALVLPRFRHRTGTAETARLTIGLRLAGGLCRY